MSSDNKTGDNKSSDNKDESFDLLAHEKRISELYQNSIKHQGEDPSVEIDSGIMAMAEQQLSDNPSLMTKDKTLNQVPNQSRLTNKSIQRKTHKAWQWPFSIAASVGILGVLMITQRDYFIHPNNIVAGDADLLIAPVMRAPDISETQTLTEEVVAKPSFQKMTIALSSQKYEVLGGNDFTAMARKEMSTSQTPKVLKEQMLDSAMLEDNSAKTSPMSLFELSKLAEVLKLELAVQHMSERDVNASIPKMQHTLFEHLIQYQKSHEEFEINEKYLSVLTDNQVQQLTLTGTDAAPEN